MPSAKVFSRRQPVEATHDLSNCSLLGFRLFPMLKAATHHRANAMLSQLLADRPKLYAIIHDALLRDRAAPCHKGALHIIDCSRPPALPALRRGRPMSAFTVALAIRRISRSIKGTPFRQAGKTGPCCRCIQPLGRRAGSPAGQHSPLPPSSRLPLPTRPTALRPAVRFVISFLHRGVTASCS